MNNLYILIFAFHHQISNNKITKKGLYFFVNQVFRDQSIPCNSLF